MTNSEYVEALDEARRKGGDWRPLEAVCYLSLHPADPRKKEIVHETLVAILGKFDAGEPSVLIAPQIGGIVANQRLQARQREQRMYKRLLPVGDDEYRLDTTAPADDEPANVAVTLEEFQERVEIVRSALAKVKAENVRQYELLWADLNDVSAAAHLQQVFGKPLKPGAVRALRHRAHASAARHLEVRKETSP